MITDVRNGEIPMHGFGTFRWGDKVRLKNNPEKICIIETLGTNPGVYRLAGGNWVVEDMIELAP